MSELLARGLNVAIPEVDVGDDILVVRGTDDRLWRVQVKTGTAKDTRAGASAQFKVTPRRVGTAHRGQPGARSTALPGGALRRGAPRPGWVAHPPRGACRPCARGRSDRRFADGSERGMARSELARLRREVCRAGRRRAGGQRRVGSPSLSRRRDGRTVTARNRARWEDRTRLSPPTLASRIHRGMRSGSEPHEDWQGDHVVQPVNPAPATTKKPESLREVAPAFDLGFHWLRVA